MAGDVARHVDGGDGRRADGRRGVRGGVRARCTPTSTTSCRAGRSLLIASGSLAADPRQGDRGHGLLRRQRDAGQSRAGPSTPQTSRARRLPVGQPEKAVIRGDLLMSRRTVANQRVLAIHLPNGSSLLISKSLAPTNAVMTKLKWVLLAVGGIGVVIAAIAGGMVARTGLRPVARLTEAAERVARTDDLRPIPVFGSDELARLTEAFNMMLRALAESRERQSPAGHRCRTRAANPADVAAHQRRAADRLDGSGRSSAARERDGRSAFRRGRPDRGIVHAGGRFGGPDS